MSTETTVWRPTIVVVGGFLGAGKTSMILSAAQRLEKSGTRCAVLLNDQGVELVDTRLTELRKVPAREVTGGCFCCRFSDLVAAIESLRELRPEVIFAEPVGSCTDIAATVLGPLREEFGRYKIAPFTVLVDPERARAMSGDNPDPNLAFLFRNQLQEADLVCLSKSDLYPETAALPGLQTRRMSSASGQGVEEWLNEILGKEMEADLRTLEIDYAQYAQAEAALAWVNLSFRLELATAVSPAEVAGPFLDELVHALTEDEIEIVHLKLIDSAPSGWVKAALCANGDNPMVEGILDASPASEHEFLLNLRAIAEPGRVRAILERQLNGLARKTSELRLDCFSPAPPVPERRIVKTPSRPQTTS
jgi:hypothetical protein